MTLYPIQDTFVRGEISPRLHSRASLDLYRGALARCENFLTLPHGGIRKRGGTYFVNETKSLNGRVRLIDFKFSDDQAYCLELGDGYCRVHAYGSYLGVDIATPWAEAHLADIQYVQSADVMWLVHPLYAPRKLIRYGQTNWTVVEVVINDGPFGPFNLDEGRRVYSTNVTGNIEANSNVPIFSPADVGRLFRIDMESYRDIPPWSPGGTFANEDEQVFGKLVRYDGNVYRSVSTGASLGDGGWRYGSTPPTHTKGIEQDGPTVAVQGTYNEGVRWEYLHSGYGVARITSYVSPTKVNITVVSRFPDQVVGAGNAQYQWSFGAFGPGNFPGAVALFEERLFFANKLSVYGSRTGNFDSFRTGAKDDDGLEFLLAANEANQILWLTDADGFLAIGTMGGVRSLSGSGVDEALTPSSFKNRSSSTPRCARQRPINTGAAFLYVMSGGRAVAEIGITNTGRFEGSEATQISEHIPKIGNGITALGYQEQPDAMAWFSLANGQAMAFTYQRDQEVRGFHRHVMADGGTIESLTVTPGHYGADDVWMCVRRTVGGQPKRFIELLITAPEYHEGFTDYCLDCGLVYSGAPVARVLGLDHLEGATVDMLADGRYFPGLIVSGGGVDLPGGAVASYAQVGLAYLATAETLELDVGGRDGSVIGRRKRITKVILSVFETDTTGLQISSKLRDRWEKVKIPTIAASDGVLPRFTGNIEVPIDDSWEGQAKVIIRHTNPTACTIRSITPAFDSEGS